MGLDFKNPSDTPVLDITTRVTLPGGLSLAEGESAEKSIIKIFGWSSGKLEWSMTGEKGTHKVLIEIEGKAIGKDLTTSMRYPVVILPNSDYNSGGDAPDGKEGALLINNNPDYVEGYFVLDNDSRDWYKALVDDVKEIQIIGGSTMGTYLKVYHEDTPLGGCDLYRGCDLKDSIVSEQGYVYVEVIRGPGTVSEYQFILELKGVQDACMANEEEKRCGYQRQNGTILLPENIYYPDAILRFGCNDTAWQWKENVEVCGNETVCIDTPLEGPHCERPPFFGVIPAEEEPPWSRPRPDDRYDISKPTYYWTGNFSPETIPEVGVLFRGHMLSTSKLLARFNEPIVFLDVNFNPDPMKYPILVIPSGGLYGLESSPSFRNKLEQYVSKGGTIFTFSQQYGYEYSALPGGLAGFGWEEDQSCLQAGVAISEYHPILSGQDSEVSDVQVDGYFTKWPENATIPLTRTKNGMPALVIYSYGNGTVIASTIFTDWNFEHGQATEDGINLVRDIIAWVKYPEEIPEFADKVNLSVNVFNYHLPFPRIQY
ncbi:MAG: hypothetical protein L6243_06555, partial [Candidatus Altiarchaeales archaeon]|nr:hypothetical protein [Candidatus Altiarchaeales archaeon]